MKIRFAIALFAITAWLPACSSSSMPSMSWFKSPIPANPTAEALFAEGSRYFHEKDYTRALILLEKLKAEHPFSPLLTEAELMIADAYYSNRQYPEAITAFKEFQNLHPTNEKIPFVLLRLGQSHLDQFTATDRDQKNTEIAKGYFENVITNHAKSPFAEEAAEKLAQCVAYLSEHEFNIAFFYHQKEKYPAARDRFEEIVRKYKGTPTAIKSIYYLGDSYGKEKNWVRAALAYEALIQHYPQSKFAEDAKTQLAQMENEKQDPLALLLMRDRRPGTAAATEVKEEPALSKLKDLNLIAKKDVVHEEPGDEKSWLRRVADRVNPFSSSDDGRKADKPETATELLVKRKEAEKKEAGGFFASLWPFGSRDSTGTKSEKSTGLVDQIDSSLNQRGVSSPQQASVSPPPADLPKNDEAPPQTMDTGKLLGAIDSNLKRSGKNADELPPPPEAAAAFNDPAVRRDATASTTTQPQPSQNSVDSGLLSSIDQKLKSQGVEPGQFEAPTSAGEVKESTAAHRTPAKVELEPKVSIQKGPLFLAPAEVPAQQATEQADKSDAEATTAEPQPTPRNLVRGPIQPQTAPGDAKPAEQRKPAPGEEEEVKGALDQLREDVDSLGKVLNPFRW